MIRSSTAAPTNAPIRTSRSAPIVDSRGEAHVDADAAVEVREIGERRMRDHRRPVGEPGDGRPVAAQNDERRTRQQTMPRAGSDLDDMGLRDAERVAYAGHRAVCELDQL